MALETTNYQCLSCSAPLRFDGATGKLVCDHCDSSFDVSVVEQEYAARQTKADERARVEKERIATAQNTADPSASQNSEGQDDEMNLVQYVCSSCGAELISDDTTAVTSCPYCDNPVVVPGQLSDEFKPDYVIPFKLEKDHAVSALKEHYKGKRLLPKKFVDGNRIEEIKGVYVPFWLYDATASGSAHFTATNSRTYVSGDDRVTETDHYNVYRSGSVDFEQVPVDGSTKMPDAHMDAIEPFDYSSMESYSVAYLPGFLAERYDQSSEECKPRAQGRMSESLVGALRDTATGYDTVSENSRDTEIEWGKEELALLPVWMLSTKWEDKNFLFAMNGQTGRLIGDLPVSIPKAIAWFLGIFIPLALIIAGAIFGFDIMSDESDAMRIGVAAVSALIVAGLVDFYFYSQMKSAHEATQADNYLDRETFELTGRSDSFSHTTVTRVKIKSDND